MSRSFRLRSHRLLLSALASLLVSLTWTTVSASAETLPATCETLQSQLNAAAAAPNHGEDVTIVLAEMCKESTGSFEIPSEASFTLEGTPGKGAGFDGTSTSAALLSNVEGTTAGSITISNLTFEHGHATKEKNGAGLRLQAVRATLSGDNFFENTVEDADGGGAFILVGSGMTACAEDGPLALKILDSTFRENKSTGADSGGGGASILQDCPTAAAVLQGDTFSENTLEPSASFDYLGGGLEFAALPLTGPPVLMQTNDVFDSNRIVKSAGEGSYGGGGEWVQGADLTSLDDRFSRNSVSGASGAKKWSWGGGLGILNSACDHAATESVVTNAVVAANKMEGGEAANDGGAGIYIGCGLSETNPNHLIVRDSTVTENTVTSGGIAGIDGHPQDHLALENSIVEGDVGGAELGGFTGEGGSLTATYSDVCSGTSPLAGTGNLCVNPLLADNGNPQSFDVHETAASPTIDAGSNALVPAGLATDAFGNTRILAGRLACVEVPKVVDMGADEFTTSQLAVPPCAPLGIAKPVPGLTQFVSIKVKANSVALKLSCKGTSAQICSGGAEITTAETLKDNGKKIVAVSSEVHHGNVPDKIPVKIAEAPFSLAGGSTTTIQLKLNKTGLGLLKRFHAMPSLVLGSEATASGPFLFIFHGVRFSEAKKPKKKKHKRHHHSKRH